MIVPPEQIAKETRKVGSDRAWLRTERTVAAAGRASNPTTMPQRSGQSGCGSVNRWKESQDNIHGHTSKVKP